MTSGKSLYRDICDKLVEYIKYQELDDGDAIPSENELVKLYSVSRITIRKAIHVLTEKGLLYSVRGKGTYVGNKNKIPHAMYRGLSFSEEMYEQKIAYVNKIVEFKVQAAGEKYAKTLNLHPDDLIYNIKRIRVVGGKHMTFEETYIPVNLFPRLAYEHLERSIYKYIEAECGMKIDHSFEEVLPILPTDRICSLLQCDKANPLIKVNICSFLSDGRVFEYTRKYCNSNDYTLKIVARR